MKKFLAVILAIVLSFALVACGDTKDTDSKQPTGEDVGKKPPVLKPIQNGGGFEW